LSDNFFVRQKSYDFYRLSDIGFRQPVTTPADRLGYASIAAAMRHALHACRACRVALQLPICFVDVIAMLSIAVLSLNYFTETADWNM